MPTNTQDQLHTLLASALHQDTWSELCALIDALTDSPDAKETLIHEALNALRAWPPSITRALPLPWMLRILDEQDVPEAVLCDTLELGEGWVMRPEDPTDLHEEIKDLLLDDPDRATLLSPALLPNVHKLSYRVNMSAYPYNIGGLLDWDNLGEATAQWEGRFDELILPGVYDMGSLALHGAHTLTIEPWDDEGAELSGLTQHEELGALRTLHLEQPTADSLATLLSAPVASQLEVLSVSGELIELGLLELICEARLDKLKQLTLSDRSYPTLTEEANARLSAAPWASHVAVEVRPVRWS